MLALLVLGCSGMADLDLTGEPPPDPAWIGRWEGPGMVVVVEPDGRIGISRHGGSTNSDVQAPVQAWRDDGIDVGIGGLTTRYRVDERPYEKDGVWRMVIEGVPLQRVDAGVPVDTDRPATPPAAPAP